MSNVIRKTVDNHGKYRYLRDVDLANYPSADWLHDPNVTALDGVVDEKYWKVSGSSVLEMSQAEKDAVDLSLENAAATTNEVGEFVFGNRGRTSNRWLRVGGLFMPTNFMPTITFCDGAITGISYVNYADNSDTDLEVYINDTLTLTWEIRDKRYAYKTNGLAILKFQPGDRISVRMKSAGTTIPTHPIVTIQYKYNNVFTGEGGASTL